jgi:hypothetical protein
VVLGTTGMPAIPVLLTLKANLHLHVIADGVALSPDISLVPAIQATSAWNVTGPFLGDISGTQQGITVNKLKGTPIGLTTGPSAGQYSRLMATAGLRQVRPGLERRVRLGRKACRGFNRSWLRPAGCEFPSATQIRPKSG